MDWKALPKNLAFAFMVTIAMNALDMVFHLFEGTAVHLGYAAVKFAIIFIVVFLTSQWVGISTRDGIFASIAGPTLFYIYYRVATPTLNRNIFKLDENVFYIFVHIACMLIAYFILLKLVMPAEQEGRSVRQNLGFALSTSLAAIALDLGYQMARARIIGGYEATAKAASLPDVLLVFGLSLAISFLAFQFIRKIAFAGTIATVLLPATYLGVTLLYATGATGGLLRMISLAVSFAIPCMVTHNTLMRGGAWTS